MFMDNYELQLQNGKYQQIIVLSHKFCKKTNNEFITYAALDTPNITILQPLIKIDDTLYADYSRSNEEIEEMLKANRSILPAFNLAKLPKKIENTDKLEQEHKQSLEETNFLPKTKEEIEETNVLPKAKKIEIPEMEATNILPKAKEIEIPEMEATNILPKTKLDEDLSEKIQVVDVEEVEIKQEEKENTIRTILDEMTHMVFKIKNQDENNYYCDRLKDNTDISQYNNVDINLDQKEFYNLQGACNILSSNGLDIKISKELIEEANREYNILMFKYKNVYYSFVVKNYDEEIYEVDNRIYTKQEIEKHPYTILPSDFEDEEFLSEFQKSIDTKEPFIIHRIQKKQSKTA